MCTTLVFVICATGCAPNGEGGSKGDGPELVADALALRDANGLFRMPEGERLAEGDAFTTAIYARSDPDGKLAEGTRGAAAKKPVADSTDPSLTTAWSAAALNLPGGQAPVLPDKQLTADAEVAVLWYYADAVRILGRSQEADRSILDRLESIDLGAIRGHPYLVWRLWDTYESLGVPQPREVTEVLISASMGNLPTTPESVFDTQAILEISSLLNAPPPVPGGLAKHFGDLLTSNAVTKDVTVASVLRSLTLLGRADESRRYLEDNVLSKRIDSDNGFVRPLVSHQGTIEGSYLMSRLLDQSFPEATNEKTTETLITSIESDSVDVTTKLKAMVALRRAGDARWQDYRHISKKVTTSLPSAVTPSQMVAYLDTVDALVQLDSSPKFPRLEKFNAPDINDPVVSRQAFLALSKASYFSNTSEIASWFPEQQKNLPALVREPSEPYLLYFSGLAAMANAPLSGLNSNDFTQATENLKDLQGCGSLKKLYRISTQPGSPCSLIISVQLMAAPGAYTFGRTN